MRRGGRCQGELLDVSDLKEAANISLSVISSTTVSIGCITKVEKPEFKVFSLDNFGGKVLPRLRLDSYFIKSPRAGHV